MKRYGDIYPKICTIENLREAHANARKDKLFYQEVKMVDADPDSFLKSIQEMLLNETYEISASDYAKSIINDKGKERELAKLAYYPHRIIQWAVICKLNLFSWKCSALTLALQSKTGESARPLIWCRNIYRTYREHNTA